jgi:hypothetical protein
VECPTFRLAPDRALGGIVADDSARTIEKLQQEYVVGGE